MGRVFLLFLFSAAAAVLMAGFLLIPGLAKYIASLGALLVGIQFFKRFEGTGIRAVFIVLTVVLSLIFNLVYVMAAIANGWYVPPSYLEGVKINPA